MGAAELLKEEEEKEEGELKKERNEAASVFKEAGFGPALAQWAVPQESTEPVEKDVDADVPKHKSKGRLLAEQMEKDFDDVAADDRAKRTRAKGKRRMKGQEKMKGKTSCSIRMRRPRRRIDTTAEKASMERNTTVEKAGMEKNTTRSPRRRMNTTAEKASRENNQSLLSKLRITSSIKRTVTTTKGTIQQKKLRTKRSMKRTSMGPKGTTEGNKLKQR